MSGGRGATGTGSGCDDDEECLSGFCNDDDLCAIKPVIGGPCSGWSDCYPSGFSSGGVCVERRGPKQSCESYEACLEPSLCLGGRCTLISLSCEPLALCSDSYDGMCIARVGEGEPCETQHWHGP